VDPGASGGGRRIRVPDLPGGAAVAGQVVGVLDAVDRRVVARSGGGVGGVQVGDAVEGVEGGGRDLGVGEGQGGAVTYVE
jgi:hypothetical protein